MFGIIRYKELERQKAKLEIDIENLAFELKKQKREGELKLAEILHTNTLEHTETITLLKLDSQQKITQGKIDHERELLAVDKKAKDEVVNEKARLAKEYYDKMTQSFTDLQMHGDRNTRFVEAMALKMIDKAPANDRNLTITRVNE